LVPLLILTFLSLKSICTPKRRVPPSLLVALPPTCLAGAASIRLPVRVGRRQLVAMNACGLPNLRAVRVNVAPGAQRDYVVVMLSAISHVMMVVVFGVPGSPSVPTSRAWQRAGVRAASRTYFHVDTMAGLCSVAISWCSRARTESALWRSTESHDGSFHARLREGRRPPWPRPEKPGRGCRPRRPRSSTSHSFRPPISKKGPVERVEELLLFPLHAPPDARADGDRHHDEQNQDHAHGASGIIASLAVYVIAKATSTQNR